MPPARDRLTYFIDEYEIDCHTHAKETYLRAEERATDNPCLVKDERRHMTTAATCLAALSVALHVSYDFLLTCSETR